MTALVLENLAALPALARSLRMLLTRLARAIDALVSARAARQIPEWQMRQVQSEINRQLGFIRAGRMRLLSGRNRDSNPLGVQSRGELARFVFESIWFACPGFADGFKGREPLQGLETLGEVIGVEERCEVLAKLVVAVVVIAPDSRLLEGAVHPLDLSVRPRVVWLC